MAGKGPLDYYVLKYPLIVSEVPRFRHALIPPLTNTGLYAAFRYDSAADILVPLGIWSSIFKAQPMPHSPFAKIYRVESEEEAIELAQNLNASDPTWKREGSYWDVIVVCLLAPLIFLYWLGSVVVFGIRWILGFLKVGSALRSVKTRMKRMRRYRKIKEYRRHRDSGDWSTVAKILTYLDFAEDNGNLDTLIRLFGLEPIEEAWLSGYFDVYSSTGKKIKLDESETYRKYKGIEV